MNGSNQNVIVICCFFSPLDQYQAWLNAAHFGQDMARVDTSFANLSLEIVTKMSRYYLLVLSGLSRIFRKPFANVYISRKVPFAQTFQIYAFGPRSYKPFMGFCTTLIYIRILRIHWGAIRMVRKKHFEHGPLFRTTRLLGFLFTVDRPGCHAVQSGSASRSKDKGRHIKSGFFKVDSQINAPMLDLLLCDWCCYRLAGPCDTQKRTHIVWHRQQLDKQKLVRFCQISFALEVRVMRGHEARSQLLAATLIIYIQDITNIRTGSPDTYGERLVPSRHQSCRRLSRKLTHSSLKTQGTFMIIIIVDV